MNKFEEYKAQVEEGRRRREEDGEQKINWIVPKICLYRRPHGNGDKIKAVIVGAYINHEYAHYMYSAYHIIDTETGVRDTIPAQWVIKSWQA